MNKGSAQANGNKLTNPGDGGRIAHELSLRQATPVECKLTEGVARDHFIPIARVPAGISRQRGWTTMVNRIFNGNRR
jgi:hypothetical protein